MNQHKHKLYSDYALQGKTGAQPHKLPTGKDLEPSSSEALPNWYWPLKMYKNCVKKLMRYVVPM